MSALPAEIDAPPSFIHYPPRDGSLLRAVMGVASKVGRTHDPAQQLAVDVITSSWRDGRPAALESAAIVSRQNLKTYILENTALTALTSPMFGAGLVVWSAHEVATAQESFRTILDLADRHAWLGSKIAKVSRATGREGIDFATGGRLRFRARVRTGGRGLAGDLIVLDEAFALTPEHMGSLLPILSTRPRGRVIYGSSAPQASSDILRRIIKRGRAGGPGAPAYIEWSAAGSLAEPGCQQRACQHEPGTTGCTLDDETLWLAANPALTHGRISLEYVRAERMALPPEEFARERLGWGETNDNHADYPITITAWQSRAGAMPAASPPPVFFLDVAPGSRSAAISAGYLVDGVPHVELVDHRQGTAGLQQRAKELKVRHPRGRWFCDSIGAVLEELPGLRKVGIVPRQLTMAQMVSGCTKLEKLTGPDGDMVHDGHPSYLEGLRSSTKRPVGDKQWLWGWRKATGDICPMVTVTGVLAALDIGGSTPMVARA
jgi:hypothetical protein